MLPIGESAAGYVVVVGWLFPFCAMVSSMDWIDEPTGYLAGIVRVSGRRGGKMESR